MIRLSWERSEGAAMVGECMFMCIGLKCFVKRFVHA